VDDDPDFHVSSENLQDPEALRDISVSWRPETFSAFGDTVDIFFHAFG